MTWGINEIEFKPRQVGAWTLEERLAPAYKAMSIPFGQLEMISGIRERRFWDPGQTMNGGAIRAGHKALEAAGRSRPVIVDVRIDYSKPTQFTRGTVKTNVRRFDTRSKLRIITRALWRKVRKP